MATLLLQQSTAAAATVVSDNTHNVFYMPTNAPTLAHNVIIAGIDYINFTTTSVDGTVDDVGVSHQRHAMEILAAIFFVIAGTWLILALLYSALVLWFLRLRSRGEIDRIYEDDFGRLYLCRKSNNSEDENNDNNNQQRSHCCNCWISSVTAAMQSFYIPLGCLFRRYIQRLHNENHPRPHAYMTLVERRQAMTQLLQNQVQYSSDGEICVIDYICECCKSDDGAAVVDVEQGGDVEETAKGDCKTCKNCSSSNISNDADESDGSKSASIAEEENDDEDEDDENLCSICLTHYEKNDMVLVSHVCSHKFHWNCALDWLQRPGTVECPCCRVPLVTEDEVLQAVKQIRKDKRKQRQQQNPQKEESITKKDKNQTPLPPNNMSTRSFSLSTSSQSNSIIADEAV